jgi:hypothetical protein
MHVCLGWDTRPDRILPQQAVQVPCLQGTARHSSAEQGRVRHSTTAEQDRPGHIKGRAHQGQGTSRAAVGCRGSSGCGIVTSDAGVAQHRATYPPSAAVQGCTSAWAATHGLTGPWHSRPCRCRACRAQHSTAQYSIAQHGTARHRGQSRAGEQGMSGHSKAGSKQGGVRQWVWDMETTAKAVAGSWGHRLTAVTGVSQLRAQKLTQ